MAANSIDNYRLDWLLSFLAVVDHGGFAAAAESTYRSQPRVSAHVAELERQLGTQLFDRKERPVRLTEAGITFLEYARRVVNDLEAGVSSVHAVVGILQGRVRLGWYGSVGAAFGPALLNEFSTIYPGIKVTLVEGSSEELAEALRDDELDVAIRPLLPATKDPALQHHTLWEEPLVAVLPDGHPLTGRPYVSLMELAEHPLITIGTDEDTSRQDEVHSTFLSAGITPRISHRTNMPQTLVGMARGGLGLGLTNLLAASVSDTAGMQIIPVKDASHRRQVCVFWNSSRALHPASRALIDLIAQSPVPEPVQRYQRRA